MNGSMKSKGFSLIEILVAIVILSISLLSLASLMAMTTKNNSYGGHVTEAVTFAQDRLEELKVTPWANIVGGADVRPGSTGINYNRTWNVSILPNPTPPPNDLLKTVTMRVDWNDGANHSINIFSIIRNAD